MTFLPGLGPKSFVKKPCRVPPDPPSQDASPRSANEEGKPGPLKRVSGLVGCVFCLEHGSPTRARNSRPCSHRTVVMVQIKSKKLRALQISSSTLRILTHTFIFLSKQTFLGCFFCCSYPKRAALSLLSECSPLAQFS